MAADSNDVQWFHGGKNFFPAMLAAIQQAQKSVDLEIYIFADDEIGRQFLHALVRSASTGVRVRVQADAYGSLTLPQSFFDPLIQAGGEIHYFNPLRFNRFGVRNHRKLLICDRKTAFIGGANLSKSYDGDGIQEGWFDLMVKIENVDLAIQLTQEFERVFTRTQLELRRLRKLRVFRRIQRRLPETAQVLSVRPGHGIGNFQRSLQHSLRHAQSVDLITPYFLPGRRLRKLLRSVVRRGGRVRLILPALCDVPIARAAGRLYYSRLLRAGVEIYEYQPQILHAKLYRVDQSVFIGSSNLDVRSFKLNYELVLRLSNPSIVDDAKKLFSIALEQSHRIELRSFRHSQNSWERWKNRWSHFLIARIDPFVALRQIDSIPRLPANETRRL